MEEGKGERYLAAGRQYGNALLGVRHQEEKLYVTYLFLERLYPQLGNLLLLPQRQQFVVVVAVDSVVAVLAAAGKSFQLPRLSVLLISVYIFQAVNAIRFFLRHLN